MKYTKQNIQKKRQILSSEKIRRNSKISLFLFKYAFFIILHSYFINALNRFVLAIIINIRRCCIFPLPYKKDIT